MLSHSIVIAALLQASCLSPFGPHFVRSESLLVILLRE